MLVSAVETITVIWIDRPDYTGYRQTIMAVILFVMIYAISRTRHIHLAAVLSAASASAIFVTALVEPTGILGGLLDFMIMPLWLASLYLSMRSLVLLSPDKHACSAGYSLVEPHGEHELRSRWSFQFPSGDIRGAGVLHVAPQ